MNRATVTVVALCALLALVGLVGTVAIVLAGGGDPPAGPSTAAPQVVPDVPRTKVIALPRSSVFPDLPRAAASGR